MAIHKDPRKPGTYYVTVSMRHKLTRRPHNLRRIGFETTTAAKRAEAKMIIELNDRLKKTIVPTWGKLVEDFSLNTYGLSEKTKHNYVLCLKAHTFEAWEHRCVDEITSLEIRSLILNGLSGKSVLTQKSNLTFIRKVFAYAQEKGILKYNPAPQMKFRVGEQTKKVLTEEQVRTFLESAKALNHEWYYHWALAVYTGMRSGELYALRWDKVCFETDQIVVDEAWNSKDGFKCTKSGHARIVEIAPTLKVILQELKLQNPDMLVLPRRKGWDKGEQARELRTFLVGLGLPAIRFHDLRATWATILLSKGLPPVLVMKMGGWRDMKTMMIYIRMAGIDTRGVLKNLVLHDPLKKGAKILDFQRL